MDNRLSLLAEIIYLREINYLMSNAIANIGTKEEVNEKEL